MTDKIKLPDFEELFSIAKDISELLKDKILLEVEIRVTEASIIKDATLKKEYWINDKPPSMSFIEGTWKYTGFENELIPLRKKLADIVSELDLLRLKFNLYEDMIGLYRTQSANERINL